MEVAKKFDPAPLTEKLDLLQKKKEEIFEKQKEFKSVEDLLDADNSRLGVEALAVKKEILEVENKITDLKKEQARLIQQIPRDKWNSEYSLADNIEKSDMLEKRKRELEEQNSDSFGARGFEDTGNVADYTVEELARYREILAIQQRIAEFKKSVAERTEQMNRRDADYERQKEIRLARRELDWKIDDLKNQGKTTEAKAILDGELAKAREAAATAKATYEELKRNTEGKVLDDFGARMLEKSRAAFEEADRYQEEMEGKVRAEQKDSEKGVKGAKETAISFSAATLAQMVGGATIQEKQLKEQQNIVKKVDDVNTTVKDKKFEIRCIA
ncbi:hypothetical protein SDC9_119756 [bioreactor metagenome]|uniref:Uncharacterized protein n=1 Tax=bioreactor metagenome TaxID=1076179 RepID=A0A645C4T9_9ZZZZ